VARRKSVGREGADRLARDFLVAARERFSELEHEAETAADELDAALVAAVDRLYEFDPEAARRLEAFGEGLIEHERSVAERSAYLRRRLERRAQLGRARKFQQRSTDIVAEATDARPELEPSVTRTGPSEGVVLLARQMAAGGADDRRIARTLSVLGVEDADDAVRDSLR